MNYCIYWYDGHAYALQGTWVDGGINQAENNSDYNIWNPNSNSILDMMQWFSCVSDHLCKGWIHL